MKRLWTFVLAAGLLVSLAACKSKQKPQSASTDVSGFSADLKKRIKDTIEDDATEEKLLFLVDESDRGMAEFNKAYLEFRDKYKNDPQISRADINSLAAEYAAVRIEFIRAIAKLRLEMRKHVTKEQWQAIFTEKDEETKAALENMSSEGATSEPPSGDSPESGETESPATTPETEESVSFNETCSTKEVATC